MYSEACGVQAFESELSAIYLPVYRSAATLATLIDAQFRSPPSCEWAANQNDDDGGDDESMGENDDKFDNIDTTKLVAEMKSGTEVEANVLQFADRMNAGKQM